MLEIILEFALVLALAGFFMMWAKWEQEKVRTKEERDNYKAAMSLHNAATNALKEIDEYVESLNAEIAKLNQYLDTEVEYADDLIDKNRDMQDKLSAILCPTNNHVWKDGCCVKCRKVKR